MRAGVGHNWPMLISLTALHGRGFFPGNYGYDDGVTIVAALEAMLGLLLEMSFIATLVQRLAFSSITSSFQID